MKTRVGLTCLLLLILFSPLGWADEPAKKKPSKEGGDEAAIRAAVDSYVGAFNAADAERVADHWSDKAVYIRAESGEKVVGRKAIAKVFSEIFAGDNRPQLKVKVDSIRLITSDVAIEDGVAVVLSGSGDEERSTYTAVHVKGKTGWKLDSVRETTVAGDADSAEGQEHLQQLEWMLGNWIDEGDDATVEYSAHFAKNKSFIVRLFKVSAPGAGELEGTQVIGWDAASKSIRSWVFDSEGGFSEGVWSRQGSAWSVKSSGYVADGRRTSSVGTFEQLDENTLIWSLAGRQVGEEKLPEIAPVKIVRRP